MKPLAARTNLGVAVTNLYDFLCKIAKIARLINTMVNVNSNDIISIIKNKANTAEFPTLIGSNSIL